jgi:uncharacterized SAM-binding protein YcdF (DUF218 family)
MFELKKIISVFITIPGIFIFFLTVTGLYGLFKRIAVLRWNLLIGIILYCISISYFSNSIIGLIEKENIYKGKPSVDAIILLGGGKHEGVHDISGQGIPSYDMTVRVVDAARLYKKYKKPIVFSGGDVSEKVKEAEIVKRFLIDLGVKEKDIFYDDISRDTVENAIYTKEIFYKKRFKTGLLVTSGYHLKRSEYIFLKAGLNVIPHSAGLLSEKKEKYTFHDFLPNIGEFKKSAVMLKESIGLFFYYIKYAIF